MTPLRNLLRFDDEHPFTGKHMLAVVLLFFGTIIAVNVAMAIVATGTFPGLVVKNSYVASQNYNQVLAEARAQEAAGWTMALDAANGILAVRIADRDGLALRRLSVTADVGRPSTTGEDRTIPLAEDGTGYRAAEALPPGQWDIAVEAREDGARVFAARERIYVQPGNAE
jgi:nitrogen fixation protein FixH